MGQSPQQIDFFEAHIRPVLAEKCYHCHNSVDTDEAGLAVDYRDGIRSETEHGASGSRPWRSRGQCVDESHPARNRRRRDAGR